MINPSAKILLIAATVLLFGCSEAASSASEPETSDSAVTTPPPSIDDQPTTSAVVTTPDPEIETTTPSQPERDEGFESIAAQGFGPGNQRAMLGISTGLSRAERQPRFESIEDSAGRVLDIGHVFHAWDKAIPTQDDLFHIEENRLLMISWNGTDTKQIAAGQHDAWIRSQATAVKDLERPLLLRWLWEMDGNRRRDWVHSGEDYVAAWNHIRDIFDEVGADNAEFVWCPNEFLFWDGGDPEPWYPGDDRVDWLCADGYNWATATTDSAWVDMVDIFGDFYDWAVPRNKPIIIGESGVAEAADDPQGKAAWLRDIAPTLQEELPEIDAFIYFDKDFRSFGHPDWRLDTSPESLDAWTDMAQHPWFNG